MAWKFIQRDLQAGDILDPADWNENVREFVQEINGAFDRDNLPASSVSTGEEVASEVFNELDIAYLTVAFQRLDADSQGNQRIQVSNQSVSTSEEMLICEASIQVDTADPVGTIPGTNFDDGYIHRDTKTVLDWCQYDLIMTLNGLEIAYAGPFTAYQRRQPIYMCGAAPVEAGSNTVECFIRLYVDRKGGATHTWASSVTDFDPRITEAAILVNRRKR
tara:strand:- start:20966 stop:21622 length:657 start_codon:yes stop_codon:yes gene_type:complete